MLLCLKLQASRNVKLKEIISHQVSLTAGRSQQAELQFDQTCKRNDPAWDFGREETTKFIQHTPQKSYTTDTYCSKVHRAPPRAKKTQNTCRHPPEDLHKDQKL